MVEEFRVHFAAYNCNMFDVDKFLKTFSICIVVSNSHLQECFVLCLSASTKNTQYFKTVLQLLKSQGRRDFLIICASFDGDMKAEGLKIH